MKKKTGVYIFVFLAVMVMGGMHPALLYSGEAGEGNIWDPLVDTSSFGGTKLYGTLSIYYQYVTPEIKCGIRDLYRYADLYLTVRLTKGGVPITFYGSSVQYGFGLICYSDMAAQADLIKDNFLADVIDTLYKGNKGWKLKSIENATYNFLYEIDQVKINSGAFVADITIAVKE